MYRYVRRPAVIVSAILAARHRTFVLVVTSLFALFFPMHNKFLLLLLLLQMIRTMCECVFARIIWNSFALISTKKKKDILYSGKAWWHTATHNSHCNARHARSRSYWRCCYWGSWLPRLVSADDVVNQLCGPEQGQGRPTRCLVPSADGARSLSQSIFIVKHTVDDRRRYAFVVLRVRYALWAAFTHCGNVRNAIMCVGRCGR